MFLDCSSSKAANGKTYRRVLLRTSFRVDGKVKHRTLGNLSDCDPSEVEALKQALRHKEKLSAFLDSLASAGPPPPVAPGSALPASTTHPAPDAPFVQGPSVGAILVLRALAEELGIVAALGHDREGKLALWQVIARALDQGSRLSAVRLARDLGAQPVLALPGFDEDDLYTNLTWLHEQQPRIEEQLFTRRYQQSGAPSLYLYDVTSTYLEGEQNELGAFGYNRDGKRGKKQVVIGLLCDDQGVPVAIEAFKGNTGDPKTVPCQIASLQQRFGAKHITLVGDRGMLRGPQIKDLQAAGMHYITAISKPQIETMLAAGSLQMELFDNALAEIEVPAASNEEATEDGTEEGNTECNTEGRITERYILRRNPTRQAEMARTRRDKKQALDKDLASLNDYLTGHPRAKATTAQRRLDKRIRKLGLGGWITVKVEQRQLIMEQDQAALDEESKLDGCYVLRTDLNETQASKETVHERYKSLAHVEQAFRRSKTVELEMRPVHVRKEGSTRGHILVVMLAYQLMRELGRRWAQLDLTVQEGLQRLNTYCAVEVAGVIHVLLQPRADVQALLDAAGVTLPGLLPRATAKVATKRKLPKSRPTRLK